MDTAMLDDKALEEQFDRLGIRPEARARIRWIRENAPIRSVGGGTRNTPVRFCSRKMKFVLEAEAFNTEYAAFEDYDNDDTVLEYYGQPCKLRISYINANNKLVHPDITPDIFVVCRDFFAFVECKTEEELLKQAKEQPNRYIVDVNGTWRSPPAEIAAAELGCLFQVRSSRDNNWVALENYEFLSDYLSVAPNELKVADDALRIIEKQLSESNWLTINDLLYGESSVDADSIYALIVSKQIYFDFLTNRIAKPEQALVFRDEGIAKAYRTYARLSVGLKSPGVTPFIPMVGQTFTWDGKPWQIINPGDHGISAMPLNSDGSVPIIELTFEHILELARDGKIVPTPAAECRDDGEAVRILKSTASERLKIASWRHEILFGVPSQTNPLTKNKPRARAYWLASFREAEIRYGVGLIGLIPNRNNTQGNHKSKCDPQAHELAIAAYEDHWETDAQRSAVLCHGFYANVCDAKGVKPISLRSFQKIIADHRSHEQRKKREGEKAAYGDEPPFLVLEYTTPRHGNRPFHIGHIDHTPLPLKLRDRSGKLTEVTLWLTFLIDAFCRYILAFYLSFDPPSYASCMMVIRECVRKHGRIPHWIVVDNGPEFHSVYFEVLLGRLGSHKKDRPKGKPKFGSVIERVFLTTIDQFISNLLGATHDMNPRLVGHDVDPAQKAIWTYERLWVRLNEYLATVYHRSEHGTLGQPPETALLSGLKASGIRSHTLFSYTEEFIVLTCPSTPKGTASVSAKGVKINYTYYRCPEMDLPGILRSRVDVRYDPANYGIAYVFLRGRWQKCYSEHYAIFQHYTEKQIHLTTNHLRLKARLVGRAISINAQILASFLASAESEEVLRTQKILDGESAAVKTAINTPVVAPKYPRNDMHPQPLPQPVSADSPPTLLEDF